MSSAKNWSFNDSLSFDNETQVVFFEMCQQFRKCTQSFIIDLFRGCVTFSRDERLNFTDVSRISSL